MTTENCPVKQKRRLAEIRWSGICYGGQ